MNVIAAGRSGALEFKNWRIYEKEACRKYFGDIVDVPVDDRMSLGKALQNYRDAEYLRYYPDPETTTKEQWENSILQIEMCLDKKIKMFPSTPHGFDSVQNKNSAFKRWDENGVTCPEWFEFRNLHEFFEGFEKTFGTKFIAANSIPFPFLVRMNNGVSGNDSYLITERSDFYKKVGILQGVMSRQRRRKFGIAPTMICVKLLNTICDLYNVNHSFRLHVCGDKIISGYARVSSPDDWVAITGKFTPKIQDAWLYWNGKCQEIIEYYNSGQQGNLVARAVQLLGLNYQGVDAVIDFDTNRLVFIEVQPTYASGYPKDRDLKGGYLPPFWNPGQKPLVDFLVRERQSLEKILPIYYNNWLDKEAHFDLCYKELKRFLG